MQCLTDIIDDFHQAVFHENQKIVFSLVGIDPNAKQYKTLFKTKNETVESVKILYHKWCNDGIIQDRNIEQNMKFFKPVPGDKNKLYCKTIHFTNGRQKSVNSTIVNIVNNVSNNILTNNNDDLALPYEIKMSEIIGCDDVNINDCIAMISELKFNNIISNWCTSIVLYKTWYLESDTYYHKLLGIPDKTEKIYFNKPKIINFHKLKEIKSRMLNSEFNVDNFISTVPYDYADIIGIELEYIGKNNYFNTSHVEKIIKLLENSLIDTCRTCPQDIYIKIGTILKLHNIAKYQSGEFGIKQLTSRVITLDHDILHKELIPSFDKYAVSEKTDGITSVVLISGKEIFITCGSIVYKFALTVQPSLPPQKNIESLRLNKIDFNDVWIFDAELLINADNHITLIPFDIRMASSINIDNINFRYRLMFMNGLADLQANKVSIKLKKWYKSSDIKALFLKSQSKVSTDIIKTDGFIFTYLDSLNFTVSMYYANKIWKWKPSWTNNLDHNTVDFLIQKCPDSLKGKSPYIAGGKILYLLCCGLSKSVHQTLPNIIVHQSLIPNNANEYIPALFTPSDRPYSHLFWSDNNALHGEIGEFIYKPDSQEWNLIKIRNDRRIEVERGNYFGNDHRTAENNWFMMNNPLSIDNLSNSYLYNNSMSGKVKYLTAIYEAIVKHIMINTETVINICPVSILEPFNKFLSVIYLFKNKIEANRYVKDKYELSKKKIRFNSYYLLEQKMNNIKESLKRTTIPMSSHGVDNLILVYSINKNDGTPGFNTFLEGLQTVKLYEDLINKNGKIIIVINDHVNENNYKIKDIDDVFVASKYKNNG